MLGIHLSDNDICNSPYFHEAMEEVKINKHDLLAGNRDCEPHTEIMKADTAKFMKLTYRKKGTLRRAPTLMLSSSLLKTSEGDIKISNSNIDYESFLIKYWSRSIAQSNNEIFDQMSRD